MDLLERRVMTAVPDSPLSAASILLWHQECHCETCPHRELHDMGDLSLMRITQISHTTQVSGLQQSRDRARTIPGTGELLGRAPSPQGIIPPRKGSCLFPKAACSQGLPAPSWCLPGVTPPPQSLAGSSVTFCTPLTSPALQCWLSPNQSLWIAITATSVTFNDLSLGPVEVPGKQQNPQAHRGMGLLPDFFANDGFAAGRTAAPPDP